MIQKIIRLNSIHDTMQYLKKEEKELCVRGKNDISRVGDIYNLYVNNVAHPKKKINIKVFLFVVLYTFSPKTLAGYPIRKRLRIEIGKVIKTSLTGISHSASHVLFMYVNYPSFREEADRILRLTEELDIS